MMMHFRSAQSQLEAISQVVSILGDYESSLVFSLPGSLPEWWVIISRLPPSLSPVTWGLTFHLVTQWRSTKFYTLC